MRGQNHVGLNLGHIDYVNIMDRCSGDSRKFCEGIPQQA